MGEWKAVTLDLLAFWLFFCLRVAFSWNAAATLAADEAPSRRLGTRIRRRGRVLNLHCRGRSRQWTFWTMERCLCGA